MKTHVTLLLGIISCLLFTTACNKFEYSPYQVEQIKDTPEHLNATNVAMLLSNEASADDTVTVLYTGDSQRYYDQLQKLVAKVNTIPGIDFMIISGDLADFGVLQEYLWINRELSNLHIPVMCAVGNHDLAANSGEAYEDMYGEKNYSFSYKKYKFVFHDTNSREYNFNGSVPNMYWLQNELKDTVAQWFVGVSHVPPYDVDFDKTLEYPYKNLFASNPRFLLSLHGHLHDQSDSYYYDDHVRYMTSNSVQKTETILLKFINGAIIKQMIAY